MRHNILIVFLLGAGFLFSACNRELQPPRCKHLEVVIEQPDGPFRVEYNFKRKDFPKEYQGLYAVKTFSDFVACVDNVVEEPYIAIIDKRVEEIICKSPLENCVCSKTIVTWGLGRTGRDYGIDFFVRVPCESITYSTNYYEY